jgi:hypothetical protein
MDSDDIYNYGAAILKKVREASAILSKINCANCKVLYDQTDPKDWVGVIAVVTSIIDSVDTISSTLTKLKENCGPQ